MLRIMDVRSRIAVIEARLRKCGFSVAQLCRRADLHPTTWVRWKNGASATGHSWRRVERALAEVGVSAEVGGC